MASATIMDSADIISGYRNYRLISDSVDSEQLIPLSDYAKM